MPLLQENVRSYSSAVTLSRERRPTIEGIEYTIISRKPLPGKFAQRKISNSRQETGTLSRARDLQLPLTGCDLVRYINYEDTLFNSGGRWGRFTPRAGGGASATARPRGGLCAGHGHSRAPSPRQPPASPSILPLPCRPLAPG